MKLTDSQIYQEIGKIVSKFELYQCYECARAVMQWLTENEIEGKVLCNLHIFNWERRINYSYCGTKFTILLLLSADIIFRNIIAWYVGFSAIANLLQAKLNRDNSSNILFQ